MRSFYDNSRLYINWFLLGIILLAFFFAFYDDYNGDWIKRKKMHRDLRFDEKIDVVISSAYWDNKWFIINDTLAFDAKSVRNDSVWLSDYIKTGDILVKRTNNDTLSILRGHTLSKFVLMR